MRLLVLLALLVIPSSMLHASDEENPQKITYAFSPPAPQTQTSFNAMAKSAGCISCHSASDASSMHKSEAVVLGCADCHGGDASVSTCCSDRHIHAG